MIKKANLSIEELDGEFLFGTENRITQNLRKKIESLEQKLAETKASYEQKLAETKVSYEDKLRDITKQLQELRNMIVPKSD